MICLRLELMLPADEYCRLTVSETDEKSIKISADVHGMKCFEARRFINNTIAIVHTDFQLTVIHGYRHGTAIRDMLADNFENSHVREQYQDHFNQGLTHMIIAA